MYDNGYGTDPYAYQPQPQPRPSRASSFLRTVLSVLVLVVLVVLLSWGLRTFVFQAYEIPSGSMEETIMPGDMVFSEKITYYGSDPAPGDIVTFQDPDPEQGGRILIKRVIAVGGQTVEIDYDSNTVYVDGEPINQDFILEPMVQPSNPAMQQTYWEVPEGSVFVMGDNRNNSLDSRDDELGPVDNRYILGKAIYTLLPAEHAGAIEHPTL
mgnify:CR=1 FL=1